MELNYKTFLSAIENAKAVDIKPGVTEEEIASATKKITRCIQYDSFKRRYEKSNGK